MSKLIRAFIALIIIVGTTISMWAIGITYAVIASPHDEVVIARAKAGLCEKIPELAAQNVQAEEIEDVGVRWIIPSDPKDFENVRGEYYVRYRGGQEVVFDNYLVEVDNYTTNTWISIVFILASLTFGTATAAMIWQEQIFGDSLANILKNYKHHKAVKATA